MNGTDMAVTVSMGGSVPRLLPSPLPPPMSSLFMQLLDSSSFPLPNALLLFSPHLALFNRHSLFLISLSACSPWPKKSEGPKLEVKASHAHGVIRRMARGIMLLGSHFPGPRVLG